MKRLTAIDSTPPGGWKYREPSTGVAFEDLNFRAMMKRIRSHRLAMDLPVTGNWVDEVHDVMARMNPLAPREEIGVPERRFTADDVVKFVQVVRELNHGGGLVSEEEQRRRADICAVCPKRGVVACRFCGWLANQITELMGNRKIPRIHEIFKHSCMACGCDLSAKTACPLPILVKVDQMSGQVPDYAPGCWMLD